MSIRAVTKHKLPVRNCDASAISRDQRERWMLGYQPAVNGPLGTQLDVNCTIPDYGITFA
jgi:hypothetical protein